MSNGTIQIGATNFTLENVSLYVQANDAEGKQLLTIDLFADTEELTKAGFAINAISLPGLEQISDLEDLSFSLNSVSDDPLNDLGESVICQPNAVLEIESIAFEFGKLTQKQIAVRMNAICVDENNSRITVNAEFESRIEMA